MHIFSGNILLVLLLAGSAGADDPSTDDGPHLLPGPMVSEQAARIAERGVETYPHIPLAGSDEREILHWLDLARLQPESQSLVRWQSRGYFAEPAGRWDQDMGLTQHGLEARWQSGGFDRPAWLGAFAKVDAMDICGRPVLPDTGERFPRQLWRMEFGGHVGHRPVLDSPGAVVVAVGSASDRPFASAEEMTFDITWVLGGMGDERQVQSGPIGVGFFINWQNNREYCNWLPVPGFQLTGKLNPTLRFAVGFPVFSLTWKPIDRLTLAGTLEYPHTVFTRASYRLADGLEVYGGFEWDNQRWYRHDREHERWRLWYDEKRFVTGLDWQIADGATLELEGGWAFDRMWFEGEDFRNREHNRLNVEDGLFLGLSLRVDW
jgi:hypothetical protein